MVPRPAWFHELKDGNEDLVEEYVAIWRVQKGMGVALGLGPFSLSPDKVAGDARTSAIRSGCMTPSSGACSRPARASASLSRPT